MKNILNELFQLNGVTPILLLERMLEFSGNFDIDEEVEAIHEGDSVRVVLIETDTVIWTSQRVAERVIFTQQESTGHPRQQELERLLSICGIKDGVHNDLDALVDRVYEVNSAWCMLHRLKTVGCMAPVDLATKLITLASNWARNRMSRFDAPKEKPALEQQARELLASLQALPQCHPEIAAIKVQNDPRGSAFTVHFANGCTREVASLALSWKMASKVPAVQSVPKVRAGALLPRPTKLDKKVLQELGEAHVSGDAVSIVRRLSPKEFGKVKDVLVELGGQWHTGRQAFVFSRDPGPLLDQVIEDGGLLTRRDYEFFPTPQALVEKLIKLSSLAPGMKVLEPEAGSAAIASAAAAVVGHENVTCYELMESNVETLRQLGFAVAGPRNFLEVEPEPVYSRVLMNPPFSAGRDIAHIQHALKFLRPDGELWCIASTSWQDGAHAQAQAFRQLLDGHGLYQEPIPAGAFADSGTQVSTVLIGMRPPAAVSQVSKKAAAANAGRVRSATDSHTFAPGVNLELF